MNYTKKSFSVTSPGTKTYAENWDRTFRGTGAFPIMATDEERRLIPLPIRLTKVPWSVIAPHEAQAQRNHGGQTLERLAERGGLCAKEALAVLLDLPFEAVTEKDPLKVQQAVLDEVLRATFAKPPPQE